MVVNLAVFLYFLLFSVAFENLPEWHLCGWRFISVLFFEELAAMLAILTGFATFLLTIKPKMNSTQVYTEQQIARGFFSHAISYFR